MGNNPGDVLAEPAQEVDGAKETVNFGPIVGRAKVGVGLGFVGKDDIIVAYDNIANKKDFTLVEITLRELEA